MKKKAKHVINTQHDSSGDLLSFQMRLLVEEYWGEQVNVEFHISSEAFVS